MTTYRAIASTETDPQAPGTSALFKALEANPTAITEGASGAPRIQALAMIGFAGKVQHGPTATEEVLVFAHPVKRIRATIYTNALVGGSGAAPVLTLRASENGGSTWSADTNLVQIGENPSTRIVWGEFEMDAVTGAWTFVYMFSVAGVMSIVRATGTMTVPANMNAMGFRITGTIASSAPICRHTVYSVGVA